jgi:hypothetical protein
MLGFDSKKGDVGIVRRALRVSVRDLVRLYYREVYDYAGWGSKAGMPIVVLTLELF